MIASVILTVFLYGVSIVFTFMIFVCMINFLSICKDIKVIRDYIDKLNNN